MSNVEFNEPQIPYDTFDDTSKITQLIIKYSGGLINDKKQAYYFFVAFIVLALFLIPFMVSSTLSGPDKPPKGFEGDVVETYDTP